jgi:hypothetical protein
MQLASITQISSTKTPSAPATKTVRLYNVLDLVFVEKIGFNKRSSCQAFRGIVKMACLSESDICTICIVQTFIVNIIKQDIEFSVLSK